MPELSELPRLSGPLALPVATGAAVWLRALAPRRWLAAGSVALLAACGTPPPAAPPSSAPVADPAAVAAAAQAVQAPVARFDAGGGQPAVVPDRGRPPFDTFAPLVLPVDPFRINGEATREFERGGASWYGPQFHGRRTASGERYDMHELTAAHRTLPFGTVVRVRSLVNGKEVDVRITDRGPFGPGRIIDVSRAAAEALGMLGLGVKDVLLLVPQSVSAPTTPPTVQRAARKARPAPRQAARRR